MAGGVALDPLCCADTDSSKFAPLLHTQHTHTHTHKRNRSPFDVCSCGFSLPYPFVIGFVVFIYSPPDGSELKFYHVLQEHVDSECVVLTSIKLDFIVARTR